MNLFALWLVACGRNNACPAQENKKAPGIGGHNNVVFKLEQLSQGKPCSVSKWQQSTLLDIAERRPARPPAIYTPCPGLV